MCHGDSEGVTFSDDVTIERVTLPTAPNEMPGLLFSGRDARGKVLVVHDIFGASPFYEGIAARLALAGFGALLPNFFFELGDLDEPTRNAAFARRARLDERQTIQQLSAAIAWLKDDPDERVGTMGFCMGGNFVLNLAAERDDLVTVSYYAFPGGLGGELGAPAPMELVDQFNGPILGFWGALDESVDMSTVDRFGRKMATRERGQLTYEHVVYPDVGHGFLKGLDDPGAGDHQSAGASWDLALNLYSEWIMAG